MNAADVIVFFSTGFWLVALGVLMLGIFHEPISEELQFGCGVTSYETSLPSILHREGKQIWNANACGACHNNNMVSDMTGPALIGVMDRFRNDTLAVMDWIHASQEYISVADPKRYLPNFSGDGGMRIVMPNYDALTYQEIQALVAYIELHSSH